MSINRSEPVNNTMVREANRRRIIQLLQKKQHLSKREISAMLNLSLPTVTQIIEELLEDGLAVDDGTYESTGGRKAKMITFVADAKLSVGVEVTRNDLRFVLIDLTGHILHQELHAIPFQDTLLFWRKFSGLLDGFLLRSGADCAKVVGVGIAFPGSVSYDGTAIEYVPVLGSCLINLDPLRSLIHYPIFLVNEANAAGFAELWADSRFSHLFYLSVSEGIGGAILINDELYTGFNNRAGEVGHTVIAADGIPCSCGRRGCLEAYISTKRLTDAFGETLDEFFRQLEERETRHTALWADYLKYLAIGISNLRLIFDMAIIIGGDIASYLPGHMSELYALLFQDAPYSEMFKYAIVSQFKSEGSALGAALQCVASCLGYSGLLARPQQRTPEFAHLREKNRKMP